MLLLHRTNILITAVTLFVTLAAAASAQQVAGDFDDDRDVDVFDHTHLLECVTGPGTALILTACRPGDFDEDEDIDLLDWGLFQTGFGVGRSPRIDRFTPAPGEWVVDDTDLEGVSIGFDRDVTVPADVLATWTIGGGSVVPSTMEYDAIHRILTLTYNPAIQNDRVTIILDYAITDGDGNELDGAINADVLDGGRLVRRPRIDACRDTAAAVRAFGDGTPTIKRFAPGYRPNDRPEHDCISTGEQI